MLAFLGGLSAPGLSFTTRPFDSPELKRIMCCILLVILLNPCGGDEGNRTLDPLLAGQVLSQLSYTPMSGEFFF